MYQQESIYNLVPKEKILPPKEKKYSSFYPPWISPTASTFILNNTSYPSVANINGEVTFPRGAHPTRGNWRTFGRPLGGYKKDPNNFTKKGHQYIPIPPPERIRSESEIRKPSVPTLVDRPIMGLKTDKNFVTSNAVDNIWWAPKKRAKEEMDYWRKKYYGQVPRYLNKLKVDVENEYKTIREMQARNEEEDAKRRKVLTLEEITTLREGLTKKLEQLKYSYGQITHKKVFDTLPTLRKKEGLEKEMLVIEKDLELLNNQNVVVDLMR